MLVRTTVDLTEESLGLWWTSSRRSHYLLEIWSVRFALALPWYVTPPFLRYVFVTFGQVLAAEVPDHWNFSFACKSGEKLRVGQALGRIDPACAATAAAK